MKFLLLAITTVCSCYAFSQREDHTWYFSETSKGLFFDFNTNTVSVTNIHLPLSYEGCGVAADPTTGNVMFYSNGIKLIDGNHLQMPNGGGLLGDVTCTTNGIPCSVPGTTDKYYVFYNSANSPNDGTIYYSIVDMSLPGNGTVSLPSGNVISTQKNVQVITNASEGFAIIPNSNGTFWMVSPQNNSNNIRILSINGSGISLVSSFTVPYSIGDARNVRFCRSNNKIAIANMVENQGCFIMDFNVSTGAISNFILIPGSILGTATNTWTGFYDCEWSPDGTKLYLSKYRTSSGSGRLYQYDLNFPLNLISLTYTLAGGNDKVGEGLKLAPDGKIYFLYINTTYSDSRFVGVINSPNNEGISCGFMPTILDIGYASPATNKFPEFLVPRNCINISVNDTTICSGQSATLTASGATTYVWNNGLDTNHQQIVSPTTTTSYIVTGTTGTCVTSDTANVFVNQNPTPSITGNLSFCTGGSTVLNVGPGYVFYNWSQGAHTQSINVTTAGTYMVTVTNANGCTGTNQVIVTSTTSNLQVTLSSNSPICEGQVLNLNSLPTGGTSYSWTGPNGFTSLLQNPTITNATTFATGIYTVTATFSGGCTATGQISTTVNPTPSLTLITDTMILLNDSIQLEVSGASSYLWSPANGLSCTTCSDPIATPNHSITYCVVGTNANGCSDTACVNISLENDCGDIWVPSAFSPNGDNENDILYVYGKCIKTMEFKIFNRWGEEVFESTDPAVGWNGVFRGKESDTDVFVYYLNAEDNFGNKYKLKGNITLMH